MKTQTKTTKKTTKTKTKTKKKACDKFKIVTDKILDLLENGTKPWSKPWTVIGYGSISGHRYTGVNPLLCAVDALSEGYKSCLFASFKQGSDKGWKLRKGSKATWIRYSSVVSNKEEEEDKTKSYWVLKWYGVYNLDLWDDSESEYKKSDLEEKLAPSPGGASPLEDVEALIQSQQAKISHEGDRAYYSPTRDEIVVPGTERFSSSEGYYATLIHELGHWTGHKSRLDRDQTGKFGTDAYAFEELVAELATAFVLDNLGIEGTVENHASYLNSWIKILKSDNKAFLSAAAAAQKAADLLLENAAQ